MPCLLADDRAQELKCVDNGFRTGQGHLCVDEALPLAVLDAVHRPLHDGLEAVFLDGPVSTDGGWRQRAALALYIFVDGGCQRWFLFRLLRLFR